MICGKFVGDSTSRPTSEAIMYCSGRAVNTGQITKSQWFDIWKNGVVINNQNFGTCSQIFNAELFQNNNYSDNIENIQDDFSNIFYTYTEDNLNQFGDPGDPGYNGDFQQKILEACQNNPGACDNILQTNCMVCNRDQISQKKYLLDFCGCFGPSPNTLFSVSRSCDSLCNREETVQRSLADGSLEKCEQDVCVIDDITINANKTQTKGIEFKQVCNNCTSGSCRCVISGISVTETASKVDIDFSKDCSSVVCLQTDPKTGKNTSVSCASVINETNKNSTSTFLSEYKWAIWLGIVLIVLAIILAIGISMKRNEA